MVADSASAAAIADIARTEHPDAVLDILFDGWGDDYLAGRDLLLGRLRTFRAGRATEELHPIAGTIYRTLIAFGEEAWDMRFVHLAVECRDALLYGL